MANQVCRAVVIGLAAALLAWTAEGAEPAQKDADAARLEKAFEEAEAQRKILDEKMYEHLKHLPDIFDAAAEEVRIRKVAAEVEGLGEIEVKPVAGIQRLNLANGRPSPVEMNRLDISGRGAFGSLHVFLVRLHVLTWRFAELETMHIKAQEGGTVSFTARLAYPRFGDWRSADLEGPPGESPEEMLHRMVRTKQLTLELLEGLSARSGFFRLVDALVVLGREVDERAIGLTEVRFDGKTVVIQGVALGASARDHLKPALEKAGFLLKDVQMSPAGICQAFKVTAGLPPADRSDEYTIGNGLFEHGTAALCEPAPAAAGRATVRGTAPAASALTLRLRDVEMLDVFQLLNELTAESFLIDDDVTGRIRADIESATVEEALAALGSAGVVVGPGPVRRVSRAGRKPAAVPASSKYAGELLDLRNRRAALNEILCVLGDLAQRKILAPPDLRGTVNMYASDLRVDQVIAALVSGAGLVSVLDGDRLLIGRGTANEIRARKDAVNVCEIPVGSYRPPESRLRSLSTPLPMLAAGDLELAGVVRKGETWTAYAFTPTRNLMTLKVGDRLSGANVSSVGPDGVALATDASGVINLALRP